MVVQSIQELVEENDIKPEEIVSIKTGMPDVYLMPHQNNPHPSRYWEAIYSTAWCFAMVIHRLPAGPDWFTEERIADQKYHDLTDKIEIVEHPPATKAFQALDLPAVEGWVDIKTTRGDFSRTKTMNDTWGSPATPMPDDVFKGKFMRVVEPSLGRDDADNLFAALSGVEQCERVDDLSAAM